MAIDMDESEDKESDGSSESRYVKDELERLRAFARTLSMDDLKEGDWFAKLLTFSLDRYVEKVDASYFLAKYPHLPADAVVDARIDMAARYAAIEGGLSATAYTGAIGATIGSGGGASPLALPGAIATFTLDLLFLTQLQLRLAYDIAVLYRVPIDLDDPDDLWKLIRVAFVVKAGELGREATLKGMPVLLRPLLRKIFSGTTLAAVKSLPVVGRYLLQRHIVKFGIPLISIPVAIKVNHWSTKVAGRHARAVFRREAKVREAATRIVARTDHHDELLWVLWLAASVDERPREVERLLIHWVSVAVDALEKDVPALDELRDVVDFEADRAWQKVRAADGDLSDVYRAAVLLVTIDGRVSKKELDLLGALAEACSCDFDEAFIKEEARRHSD